MLPVPDYTPIEQASWPIELDINHMSNSLHRGIIECKQLFWNANKNKLIGAYWVVNQRCNIVREVQS